MKYVYDLPIYSRRPVLVGGCGVGNKDQFAWRDSDSDVGVRGTPERDMLLLGA